MSGGRGVFGGSWTADGGHDVAVPTPVGQPCLWCGEPIAEGDQGQVMPVVQGDGRGAVLRPAHRECVLRSVMGSVAHMEGRCSCFGGDDPDDVDGGSGWRREGLALDAWLRRNAAWPRG